MLDLNLWAGGIRTVHPPAFCYDAPRGHRAWLFMCFGTPFVYRTDTLHTGKAGDCILHPPGAPILHGPLPSMTEGFVNDWFYFMGDDADALAAESGLPLNTAFSIADPSVIRPLLERILEEHRQGRIGSRQIIACKIAEILVELKRGRLCESTASDPTFRMLAEARDRIHAHPEEHWTLERMARLAGYSTSRFTLLYRQHFECSPTADLIRARIRLAHNLLLSGEHTVSRVSEQCGFSSVQYFTRTYRALTGQSPSETKKGALPSFTK